MAVSPPPAARIVPIRSTLRWCEADGWHIGYVLECGCRVEAPERSRHEAGFPCPAGHAWPPPRDPAVQRLADAIDAEGLRTYEQRLADGEVGE